MYYVDSLHGQHSNDERRAVQGGVHGVRQDLVGAAVFLSSDASAFVNGHVLYVDGGVTASL